MAVPIVAFPNTFYTFSSLMVGMVDPGALSSIAEFGTTRLLVGGGYGSLVLAHLGLGFARRDGSGSWLADAAETCLLIAYFAVVPVVVAVGLYFPLWYSTRQVARELAVEDTVGSPERDLLGGTDAGAGTVALRAWGVLVGGALATAAVAAAFWVFVPNPFPSESLRFGAVAFWSVFISVVALPHVVVGSVFDRGRGIWHVP
jgi:Brp/Blh family beta-carotene 15,15'-monooxygenase